MSMLAESIRQWRDTNTLGRHERVENLDDESLNVPSPPPPPPTTTTTETTAETTVNTTPNTSTTSEENNDTETPVVGATTETSSSVEDEFQRQQQQQRQEELAEERESIRRKNLACTLLLVMILARLWAQALYQGDFALVIVCLFSTSWTVKWIRMRHEAEMVMDQQIHTLSQNPPDEESALDIRFMSFQSQLAYAIMESQRHVLMMENNGGMPSNHPNSPEPQGVSDHDKASWHKYSYVNNNTEDDDNRYTIDDDLPSCSICLCEYEPNDALVALPCKHVYHQECIDAWCESHHRCPLCNCDLIDEKKTTTDSSSSQPEETIV